MRVAEGQQASVKGMVDSLCPGAQPGQATATTMNFIIPQQNLDLPHVFASIEDQRSQGLIEEYALSQTTLENVFISLAESNSSRDESNE